MHCCTIIMYPFGQEWLTAKSRLLTENFSLFDTGQWILQSDL